MQPKMGGKYHLKLNNGERPIANKYREGKMKRTLKRELNSTWNCQKGNAWNQYCSLEPMLSFGVVCSFYWASQHQFDLEETRHWKVVLGHYSLWRTLWVGLRSAVQSWVPSCLLRSTRRQLVDCEFIDWARLVLPHLCLGCWRNGFKRPVLKHGPRSLTYMRVFGW